MSVHGVGINDVKEPTRFIIDGHKIDCPYYRTWTEMLRRCYSKKCQQKFPTYVGCYVCDEWLLFSKFKQWMAQQEWVGKELDKDILCQGNKVYSPATCIFISANVNLLLTAANSKRGKYMIGVYWDKKMNKFKAQCNNGSGRQVFLGYYDTELKAHLAWKAYKHRLACKLADEQPDIRVAEALRTRYL